MSRPQGAPFADLFARFLEGLAGGDRRLFAPGAAEAPPADPNFRSPVAALCAAMGDGHVCLDLRRPLPGDGEFDPVRDAPEERIARLRAHPLVGTADGAGHPLVLDPAGRLYLAAVWRHEQALAADLRRRAARFHPPEGFPDLPGLVARLGEGADSSQRRAMVVALLHGLCIVSGGPGTGKTTTAARILALCAACHPPGRPPRFHLAAPTGKAAARLAEAIRSALATLPLPEGLAASLPREAATLHRLLEPRDGSNRFRRDAGNPLDADLVLIDEASMVPLSLMHALTSALPPHCRLVLLGDRNQLASVEPGRVLGDLCDGDRATGASPRLAAALRCAMPDRDPPAACGAPARRRSRGAAESPLPLSDSVARLEINHRSDRAVAEVANRILAAATRRDADALLADLARDEGAVRLLPLPPAGRLGPLLAEFLAEPLAALAASPSPAAALQSLGAFRLLCATRVGPFGAERANALVEAALARGGRIDPRDPWHDFRPLLVTGNDYALRLFNGDVGVVHDGRAHFPDGEGTRAVPPSLLSAVETCYAMTVHKSQGSEFDRVLLVLPDRAPPGLLTKELLYTAVTRARHAVTILAPREVARAAILERTMRDSGLRDALHGRG